MASSRPQKLPSYGEPGVGRGPLHRQTWDPGLWALKSELIRGPGEPVAHRTPHLLLCVGWGLTLTLTVESEFSLRCTGLHTQVLTQAQVQSLH